MAEFEFKSVKTLKMKREIRDPLYGYIHITNFENDIIDSEIFQRLDRILQMPTAHMAYPSGKYSRKTHSLGVMHLVHKAMLHIFYLHSNEIQKKISPLLFGRTVVIKEDKDRDVQRLDQRMCSDWWDSKGVDKIVQYARLAALLHDIGHAPFSHTFEAASQSLFEKNDVSKEFDHEEAGIEIITKKGEDLKIRDPFYPDDIADLLKKDGNSPSFMKKLISGPFDCDKLDYMMRDAHHLGTPEYGNIDYERIIDGIRIKESRLCISSSSLHALVNSFRAIQSMYTAIYYHRTARIFDFMIQDALECVPDMVKEISTSIDTLITYDDASIISEIHKKSGQHGNKEYEKAYELFKDFFKRKKRYKCILECPANFSIKMKKDAESQLDEIKSIVNRELGFENMNIKIDFKPTILPIRIDLKEIRDWLRSNMIYTEDGNLKSLKDVSGAYYEELSQYIIILRIYIDRKSYKAHENTINEKIKNIKNEIKLIVRD